MKLIIFKVYGDGDYGYLSFEASAKYSTEIKDRDKAVTAYLDECYEEMLEGKVLAIAGNDPASEVDDEDESAGSDWIISIEREIPITSREEAMSIVLALETVLSEDFCGDYDTLKNTNYLTKVVP